MHSCLSSYHIFINISIEFDYNRGKLLVATLLHDIGKIIVPTEILNKPKLLNVSERKIINTHAFNGKMVLDFYGLYDISDFVCYHHERMDGKGYLGLVDKEIPLASKIISIVDTFSALTTDRVYQKAKSACEAHEILREVSDSQLDGELIDLFCQYS